MADGAEFLREVEDEAYDLIVCDLEIGSLLQKDGEAQRQRHNPQISGSRPQQQSVSAVSSSSRSAAVQQPVQ